MTEALTGRALDAEVAERVMGLLTVGLRVLETVEECNRPGFERTLKTLGPLPPYSTDHNAAHIVQERIAALNLEEHYADYLALECQPDLDAAKAQGKRVGLWWCLAHASPEQRCRAALKAAEELHVDKEGEANG